MKPEFHQIMQAMQADTSFPNEVFTMSLHSLGHLPDLLERTNGIHNAWMYPEERYFRILKNALKGFKCPVLTIAKRMALTEALQRKFDTSETPFLWGDSNSIHLNNVYFTTSKKNNVISCNGQVGIVQSFDVPAAAVTVKLLKKHDTKWYGIGRYMREQPDDESNFAVFSLQQCKQKNYIKVVHDDNTDLMIEL
jgi:hypothetical protein